MHCLSRFSMQADMKRGEAPPEERDDAEVGSADRSFHCLVYQNPSAVRHPENRPFSAPDPSAPNPASTTVCEAVRGP
jgi:hypothetical protein